MEHQTAVDRRFTERYLLGELSSDEAAEFEVHFFECDVCAEEVRQSAHLAANLKAVLREAPIEIPWSEPFVELTIPLDPSENATQIECEFHFAGMSAPLVATASAVEGSLRLRLPAGRCPLGPCTVLLRDKTSKGPLGRRQLLIV